MEKRGELVLDHDYTCENDREKTRLHNLISFCQDHLIVEDNTLTINADFQDGERKAAYLAIRKRSLNSLPDFPSFMTWRNYP